MNFIKQEIKKHGATVALIGWLTLSAGAILCHIALMAFLKTILLMGA